MNRIDLHTHSSRSDGTLTPAQLIREAYDAGLYAVALTDHDTADGLLEARAAADKLLEANDTLPESTSVTTKKPRAASAGKELPATPHPFEFIPGIELSVSYMERELHIVGLYLDISSKAFHEALFKLQENRNGRNEKMIARMQAAGIDITMEKLYADQGEGVKTRANFARYLLAHGYIKTIQEGFDKYLEAGKPFYVPREYMSPQGAIDLIHSVGGIAILAHPLLYHFSMAGLETALLGLSSMGLDGMEVYYAMNTPYDTAAMKKLAQKYKLLPSGGSDFHGSNKPHIRLGAGRGSLYIPEDVLNVQKAYLKR